MKRVLSMRKRPYDDKNLKLDSIIAELFQRERMQSTKTKAGWCLRDGMTHILAANNHALASVVKKEGLPTIYDDGIQCRHDDIWQNKPQSCFESLCRIVAGQQLAGSAATAIWLRLSSTTKNNVNPSEVLKLAKKGVETHLQKPSGLSRAKAHTIVALSEAFVGGSLSESFLTSSSEEQIRKALLDIKGIGPWSCDMFLIFHLQRANILPIGDLGVRKGIAKLFSLRGKGSKGSLCPKKDLEVIERVMQPYQPYLSIATYYMWKVADTKDVYDSNTAIKKEKENREVSISSSTPPPETPTKPKRKRTVRQVTP